MALSLPVAFPDILYEDNHMIAVNKPAGILSQPDGSDAPDVLTILKSFIKTRDHKPGNVFLGLVHRLDRPVSGVMVVAKTSKAASRLSTAFRDRTVKKVYRAVIEGDATALSQHQSIDMVHQLKRDESTRVTRTVQSGGKKAHLKWKLLRAQSHQSVVEITLITGLPHQIRAQFAAIGHPIVADKKYGSKRKVLNHRGIIALYCHQMELPHPTKNETIVISCNPPHPLKDDFRFH